MKSYILVGLQLLLVGHIAISGPLWAESLFFQSLELIGIALGGWAILAMKIANVSILPDVRSGATLTLRGPYRIIRHPMYTALLVVTLAVVLDDFSLARFSAWCLLLFTLTLKLTYEEKLLTEHFEEYASYRSRTWRIIPFVY